MKHIANNIAFPAVALLVIASLVAELFIIFGFTDAPVWAYLIPIPTLIVAAALYALGETER